MLACGEGSFGGCVGHAWLRREDGRGGVLCMCGQVWLERTQGCTLHGNRGQGPRDQAAALAWPPSLPLDVTDADADAGAQGSGLRISAFS